MRAGGLEPRVVAVPWRVMVIDEAHRLKNKDSALAAELRAIPVEHTIMLTGTPLQVYGRYLHSPRHSHSPRASSHAQRFDSNPDARVCSPLLRLRITPQSYGRSSVYWTRSSSLP